TPEKRLWPPPCAYYEWYLPHPPDSHYFNHNYYCDAAIGPGRSRVCCQHRAAICCYGDGRTYLCDNPYAYIHPHDERRNRKCIAMVQGFETRHQGFANWLVDRNIDVHLFAGRRRYVADDMVSCWHLSDSGRYVFRNDLAETSKREDGSAWRSDAHQNSKAY